MKVLYRKKIAVLLSILLCLLCLVSCGNETDPGKSITENGIATQAPETVLRDPNGMPIPVYSDVERANLDPELLSLDENGRIVYADPAVQLYYGVDVSAFQGDIDWNAVKNDGVDFVMLRLGGRGWGEKGLLYTDDAFFSHYRQATEAGLKVGAYFFSQAVTPEEAEEEARYALDFLKDTPLDYPVAYDWEHIEDNPDARTNNVSDEILTACALRFCQVIEEGGYRPIIYFNRKLGYFFYDLSLVNHYGFWLAEFNTSPAFIYDYQMWQYSESGTVNGIDTIVDLNISLVDYSRNQ